MIYRMLSFNWYQQGRLTLYSDGASAPPTKLGGRKFRTSGGMYDNSMKHSLLVAFIVMKISQISSQIVFLNAINLIFWLLGAFPQTPTGWTLLGNFRPPGLRHQFFLGQTRPWVLAILPLAITSEFRINKHCHTHNPQFTAWHSLPNCCGNIAGNRSYSFVQRWVDIAFADIDTISPLPISIYDISK